MAWSTPTPGMTAPDENRRLSDRAGLYPDKLPPFQLAPGPSPVMTLRPVCAGIEQGCGCWQVSRETKGSNWNLVVVCIRVVHASTAPLTLPRADDESRFASGPPDASSPVSPCHSRAALVIATLGRPDASPRFRSSPGSLAAHDELVNGRRARPQRTWLRHAELVVGHSR